MQECHLPAQHAPKPYVQTHTRPQMHANTHAHTQLGKDTSQRRIYRYLHFRHQLTVDPRAEKHMHPRSPDESHASSVSQQGESELRGSSSSKRANRYSAHIFKQMGVCSTRLKMKGNKEKQTGNYMQTHIFEVMIPAFCLRPAENRNTVRCKIVSCVCTHCETFGSWDTRTEMVFYFGNM